MKKSIEKKSPKKAKNFKLKSLDTLIEQRLTKEEIAEIDRQVALEMKILRSFQGNISNALNTYMEEQNIGFNELVELLHVSPAHIAKIKKGNANLTIASIARLFAILGQEPHLIFK